MKYPSDDESSSLTSGSGGHIVTRSLSSPRHRGIHRSPPDHSSTPTVTPLVADLEPILQELRERREEYQHLVDEVEGLKVK